MNAGIAGQGTVVIIHRGDARNSQNRWPKNLVVSNAEEQVRLRGAQQRLQFVSSRAVIHTYSEAGSPPDNLLGLRGNTHDNMPLLDKRLSALRQQTLIANQPATKLRHL
jgi:hypothetical protein